LHAAHGYLLSSFLSPKVNHRGEPYGGSAENRRRLLLEIVSETRAATGPGFLISVKLNTSDFQKGGFDIEDSLEVLKELHALKVDFVELSGGSYESTAMMGN